MANPTEDRPVAALAWVVAATALLTPLVAVLVNGPMNRGMAGRGASAVAMALLVAPLVEEAILRPLQRGLGEALLRRGLAADTASLGAATVATLVFAAVHLADWSPGAVRDCLPWLVPGAALAATWCWRRRVTDCMLLHAFFNASLWLAGAGAG